MKLRFFLCCFLQVLWVRANMASPVQEGTLGTRPFISQHVHIIHENLRIVIDENFQYANFDVEYIINAEKSGEQIPLLFYASEYYQDFQVYVDGKLVALERQEDFWNLYGKDKEKLANFHYLYTADRSKVAEVDLSGNERVSLNDFLYFKTDLSEGEHRIKVTYKASHWRYKHSRLNEDSFRYVLAPAKYWKSFGTLNVTIDASAVKDEVFINIGTPKTGDINGVSIYTFDKLPLDVIEITRKPSLSAFAQFLLNIESFGLSMIFILFFIVIHIFFMYRFRKKQPEKRLSFPAILGAIMIPVLYIILSMAMTLWIDASIGKPYASERQSYGAFFEFLFLPYYLAGYILFTIIVDIIFKKIAKKR